MIRVLMLAVLLTACGGGGGSDNTPTTPPTPPTPTYPAEGTIADEECSADEQGVKIITYNDGSGGTYTEREERSEDCGYVEVTVTMVDDTGDRWDPVVLTYEPADAQVTAKLPEAAAGWARIIIGNGRIEIYGNRVDASTAVLVTTPNVEDDPFRFTLQREPRCENSATGGAYKIDCMGYEAGGRSASMIYYGEDDTRVVDIEVGFVRSNDRYPDAVAGTRVPDGHPVRQEIEDFLAYANDFNERSKVYIRFVLSEIVWGDPWTSIYDFGGGSAELMEISDMVYGWGSAGGNNGQAIQPKSIYPSMTAIRSVGASLGDTALHELGHAMGLGHGPWGDPYWTLETTDPTVMTGSIFPRFGHGWTATRPDNVCGVAGSIMTYSNSIGAWTNSLLSCEELGLSGGKWGDAAGSRQYTDEAYALNRVRYSLSLIHDEYNPDQVDPVIPSAETEESEEDTTQVWEGDTCPRSGTLQTGLIDCQGYAVTSAYPEEGYIYYGEDDTTVVTWEVALLTFKQCGQEGLCDQPLTQQEMDAAEKTIADMQEILDRSRVYVNLELKYARNAYFTGLSNIPETDFNVDAVLAYGGASPSSDGSIICGYGGFRGSFDSPLRPWGICGFKSLLHELGHTAGLAHGPENSRNAGTGYLFPNFGHGFPSPCPGQGSVMAYDTGQTMFSNSLYTCAEVSPYQSGSQPAGIRGPSGYDEAYALNRVRYNIANINGE